MENVTKALILAFSMLIFVVAFSYAMYLINGVNTTASTLLETITTTKYYDNIEVSSSNVATREVGIDTIISVLYRYYKENYAVKIIGKDGSAIQVFDVDLEGKVRTAQGYTKTDDKAMVSLKNSPYNKKGEKVYLFEAPWIGNTNEYTRTRIDYFLNGTKGYINNTLVDYSKSGPAFDNEGGFIKNYRDKTFIESFVEYAYQGETISTEDGVETITGSTQESSKIIITYTVK